MGSDPSSWRGHLACTVKAFRLHIQIYRTMLGHPRTPYVSRILLGLALAYALSPIDLIPDFLPVIGHLDDVLVIPVLVWLALCFIPTDVKEECRLLITDGDHEEGEGETHGSQME